MTRIDNFSQILIDWNGSGWIRDYALTQSIPNNGFFDGSKPDLYKPMNSYDLPAQSIIDYANGEELKILLGIEIESWTSDWMTQLSPPDYDGFMLDLGSRELEYRKMIPSDSYEIPTPTPTPTPDYAKIDYQLSVSSEIYEEESFNLKLGLGEDVNYHDQYNNLRVFYEITQGADNFHSSTGEFTFSNNVDTTTPLQSKRTSANEGARTIEFSLTGDSINSNKWTGKKVSTTLYEIRPKYTLNTENLDDSYSILEGESVIFKLFTENVPSATKVTIDLVEFNKYPTYIYSFYCISAPSGFESHVGGLIHDKVRLNVMKNRTEH